MFFYSFWVLIVNGVLIKGLDVSLGALLASIFKASRFYFVGLSKSLLDSFFCLLQFLFLFRACCFMWWVCKVVAFVGFLAGIFCFYISVSGSRFLDVLRPGSWIRYLFIICCLISASGLCHFIVML